jgi:hypothetical protein
MSRDSKCGPQSDVGRTTTTFYVGVEAAGANAAGGPRRLRLSVYPVASSVNQCIPYSFVIHITYSEEPQKERGRRNEKKSDRKIETTTNKSRKQEIKNE